ncbi:peptidoglycan editing factor PgeF [Corynebacterium heidelbergense]|uniref:Purine nucleoside phosphorylase n=1 Tax=Corynebacterium heidelbergense TaxID=2055947 RepID=A0A364VBS7_9CORY|nr:peptidoglycan editing factor PgeF [Corynebacterium heidelbergense]RAV34071.1 peptidoglycan editing factor PgeF [Corynebacterium heidelbergense]WCZ36374.1 Laccase domain protein YfiH [Corynebacterium heidelbergense]
MTTSSPTAVRKAFSNRFGGASAGPYESFNLGSHVGDDPAAVRANRSRLAAVLGVDTLVFMEQIHSPTVTEVTAQHLRDRRPLGDSAEGVSEVLVETTDALIATVPDIALVVLTADCVPLLLSDDSAGVIAAVHAGRMGARNGIVARTVARMVELGAAEANIHALMGPAASGDHYEVPEAMAADVEAKLPGSRTRTTRGTPGLDIRSGIARQLSSLGVRTVDIDPRCTIADHDYFSYRRDGTTGRQAGVVWLDSRGAQSGGGHSRGAQ